MRRLAGGLILAVAIGLVAFGLWSNDEPEVPAGFEEEPSADGTASGDSRAPLLRRGGTPPDESRARSGDGTMAIEGHVVRPDGSPCPKRLVRAFSFPLGAPGLSELERTALWFQAPAWGRASTAIASTDTEGHFVLAGLDPSAIYLLVADAEAPECSGTFWLEGANEGDEPPADLRIVVGQGIPIRLRVHDAKGNGLKAWVSLHVTHDEEDVPDYFESWCSLPFETDAEGVLELASVPNCPLHADVAVPWKLSARCLCFEPSDSGEISLGVEPASGADLGGHVTDPEGRVVSGARVIVWVATEDEALGMAARVATTDEEGAYEILSLPEGLVWSLSVLSGGRLHVSAAHFGTKLTAGARVEADVQLQPRRRIVGRVLSKAGEPLAGIAVRVLKLDIYPQVVASATSAGDGSYVLQDVGFGERVLQAAGRGWHMVAPKERRAAVADILRRFAGGGMTVVTSKKEEELRADLKLERGLVIRGRTVNAEGKPVSGAEIVAAGKGADERRSRIVQELLGPAVSGEDGRFEVFHFRRGATGSLRATLGRLRSPAVQIGPASAAKPVTLVLRASYDVAGFVLDPRDQPVKGIELKIEALGMRAVTDAEGAFRFRAMAPGTYRIVYEPDRGSLGVEEKQAEIKVSAEDDSALTLGWEATGEVRGVVVDSRGRPVHRATVQLLRAGARDGPQARTKKDGRFVVRWVGDGPHGVKLEDRVLEETVEAGATDVRLVLERDELVVLAGRVVDERGVPLIGGWVRVLEPEAMGGRQLDATSLRGGRFEFDLADPPRRVRLEIKDVVRADGSKDLQPLTEVHDVDPRGPSVEVLVADGLALGGKVIGPAGLGVSGVEVQVTSAEGGARRSYSQDIVARTRTQADGTFRFAGMGKGAVRIRVLPSEAHAGVSDITAVAGSTDVTIRVEAGLVARFVVRGPDGAPVPDAIVRVFDPDERWFRSDDARLSGRTDAQGRLILPGLTPGEVNVSVGPPAGEEMKWPHPVVYLRDVDLPALETVTIPRGHRVEVEVVGADGEPCVGGDLEISPAGSSGLVDYPIVASRETPHRYTSAVLFPGSYELGVESIGGHLEVDRHWVEVPGPLVKIRLKKAHIVRGRVLGAEIGRIHVEFIGRHESRDISGWDHSNDRGDFEILLPQPARGLVFARGTDSDEYALLKNVQAPCDGVVLRLQKGLRIEGHLVGWPKGETGRVSGEHELGLSLDADVGLDGAFAMRAVPPGRVRLEAWMPDYTRRVEGEAQAGATGVRLGPK